MLQNPGGASDHSDPQSNCDLEMCPLATGTHEGMAATDSSTICPFYETL